MRKLLLLLLLLLTTGCVQRLAFNGVVAIRGAKANGSGVVVGWHDNWWLVATAAHVTADVPYVLVNADVAVEIIRDTKADVSLLTVPDTGQRYYIWPTADARLGEECVLLAWMYDPTLRAVPVAYRGYVSATDWRGHLLSNCGMFMGTSGGPLINLNGQVIGLANSVVITRTPTGGYLWDSTAMFTASDKVRNLMGRVKWERVK